MEFQDMRRILRRFDLPTEGFEDVLIEVSRLKDAALTGSPRGAPSKSDKAKDSRAA